MPRQVLFTHNDLDALTSALLASVAMPDADVFFCTYDNFPSLVQSKAARYDTIWVADLSMKAGSPEAEALRDAEADVVRWFDHHASSDDMPWMNTCVVDRTGTKCAADLVAEYVASQGHEIPAPLQTLLDYAHDQDLWIRALPEASQFDDILGSMAIQDVYDLLRADALRVYQPTEAMAAAADRTARERVQSLALAEASASLAELGNGKQVKVACCWGSTSEVGDAVGDENTLVALLDMRALGQGQLRFSLRTRSTEINASLIAEQLGGGGHRQAAGASVEVSLLKHLTSAVAEQVVAAARAAGEAT